MAAKMTESERFREREISHEVAVDLTEDQLKKKRHQLGKAKKDLEAKLKEKSETVAKLNTEINDLEELRDKLIVQLDAGTENKKMACVERFDFQRNKVAVLRADNNEVVHERAMAPEERQEMMNPPRGGKADDEDQDQDQN